MTRCELSQRVYDRGRRDLELVAQLAKRFHPVIYQEEDVFSLVRTNSETEGFVNVWVVIFHLRVLLPPDDPKAFSLCYRETLCLLAHERTVLLLRKIPKRVAESRYRYLFLLHLSNVVALTDNQGVTRA